MQTVALEGLEFFAKHGYHREERIIGNKYGVDITVSTDFSHAAKHDELAATVNYEHLYQIITEEMAIPTKLLERLAGRIVNRVFAEFSEIQHIHISIRKYNPPIGGVCRSATVKLSEARD